MATITWPAELPQDFNDNSYTETILDNRIRDDFDVGPACLRRKYTITIIDVVGSMYMTTDQYNTLEGFIRDELLERSLAFGFPAQGVSTAAEWLVMMLQPPMRVAKSNDIFEVTLNLRVLP